MATVERGGVSVKELFLPRRSIKELISEELRRLNPDETFEHTMGLLDVDRLVPDDNPIHISDIATEPTSVAQAIENQQPLSADLANPKRHRGLSISVDKVDETDAPADGK